MTAHTSEKVEQACSVAFETLMLLIEIFFDKNSN